MKQKKIFGVILAGGKGTRMGNVEKPKQFMEIGGKAIIVHTIEKFVIHPAFDEIIVLSPKQWLNHTKDIVCRYIPKGRDITIIAGGSSRNETIMNAIRYIEETYGLTDDTVIVTHDSVRPFISHRILEENIQAAIQYGACDTVVPATDTIVCSEGGKIISDIPERSKMYQGQTPQSFRAKKLKELYESLTEEEKELLTDACKIMTLKGEKVYLVEGEVCNIKITYPYDIKVAEAMLGGNLKC